jgi:hypothetical protein
MVMVRIILHIDAAFGKTGKYRPGNKGVEAVFQQ